MAEVVPPIPEILSEEETDAAISAVLDAVADPENVTKWEAVDMLHASHEALRARVEELTAALAFYADPDTWRRYDYKPDPAGASWEPAPIESDNQGDRARAALRGGTPWLR